MRSRVVRSLGCLIVGVMDVIMWDRVILSVSLVPSPSTKQCPTTNLHICTNTHIAPHHLHMHKHDHTYTYKIQTHTAPHHFEHVEDYMVHYERSIKDPAVRFFVFHC